MTKPNKPNDTTPCLNLYGGFPWVFRGTNLSFQFGTYVKPRPTQESTVPKYQSTLHLLLTKNNEQQRMAEIYPKHTQY